MTLRAQRSTLRATRLRSALVSPVNLVCCEEGAVRIVDYAHSQLFGNCSEGVRYVASAFDRYHLTASRGLLRTYGGVGGGRYLVGYLIIASGVTQERKSWSN